MCISILLGEFNAASTSSLAANTAPDIYSPSSSIRVSSRANEPINPTGVILTQKKVCISVKYIQTLLDDYFTAK